MRDITIDILRGLAVFTMIAANLAGTNLAEPHPLGLRLYGTFAAPMFVLLSGMMVGFATLKKSYTFGYFFIRGMIIVLAGAAIDILCWQSFPFCTFDVLYIIGIAMILCFFFVKLPTCLQIILTLIIFGITPFLQSYIGYAAELPDVDTLEKFKQVSGQEILRHFFVDGWFPFFPWVAFAFSGVILSKFRWQFTQEEKPFGNSKAFLLGLGILLVGAVTWYFFPGALYVRDGYSEMFYPAMIGYMITSIGVILTLFALVDLSASFIGYRLLLPFGEAALFMYILHLVFIAHIIPEAWEKSPFVPYLGLYIALCIICLLCGLGLRWVRSLWPKRHYIVRMFIG